jgi:hypothetical protein
MTSENKVDRWNDERSNNLESGPAQGEKKDAKINFDRFGRTVDYRRFK